MLTDPIRGQTIRWSFDDGPMAGKVFEHSFDARGGVTWRMLGGGGSNDKPTPNAKYEMSEVGEGVYAVSYLSDSGHTLTVVLDYRSGHVVAFASNEKELSLQHGSFETIGGKPSEQSSSLGRNGGGRSHASKTH